MAVQTLASTRNVVVADDTEFVRDRFRAAIEGAGHRAVTVRTGAELLSHVGARPEQVHLVIVDLRLPGSNGVGLVRKLRQLLPQQPPVVVFSGTIANAGEVRALGALGVAGYLNEYIAVQHIMPALLPYLSDEGHTPRCWPRAVLAIPVSYRVHNTIATGVTLNLSAGGIAIRTASPLEAGTCVRLRFSVAGCDVEAAARVVWGDSRLGMGLEFTGIEGADRDAIARFVEDHFFSYRKG